MAVSIKLIVGKDVLLNKPGILPKLALPQAGTYLIEKVYDNATITITKRMAVTNKVNIWQLQSYYETLE